MRIAVLATCIATAIAAFATPVRADPPPLFSGAYIGLNAGGTWGSSKYETDPGCPAPAVGATFCNSGTPSAINGTAVASSGTGKLSSSAFTGGVQGGYNWQTDGIVFGGEADFGAFNLNESVTSAGAFPTVFLGNSFTLSERMSTNWLATIRGRAGLTVTPALMLYATGGVAFTDFKFSSGYGDNAIGFGFPGGSGFGSKSGTRTGWAAGGGGEWLLDGCWSIKAEYLYLDFGSESVAVPTSNTAAFAQTMFVDADLHAQLARLGLNFRY